MGLGGFQDEGWVLLRSLVTGPDLQRAQEQVAAILGRPLPEGCARPYNTLVPLRWSDDLVLGLLRAPRVIEAIATATSAADLRWISGYVSVKEPDSPPLWWHQDWWCWQHPISFQPQAAQVAVLCYLDVTDKRTGALRLLPGSHRRSVSLHAVIPEAHAEEERVDPGHAVMVDQTDQVTVDAQAGDAVVIDYRLLHGTHPNEAPRRRCCLILNFAPAWDQLPDDIKAHLIQHPAQPSAHEQVDADLRDTLPAFSGERRELPLTRHAPARFAIA